MAAFRGEVRQEQRDGQHTTLWPAHRAASLYKTSQWSGPPAVRFCDALEISPGGTPKSTGVGCITKPIPKPYPIRPLLVDMAPEGPLGLGPGDSLIGVSVGRPG